MVGREWSFKYGLLAQLVLEHLSDTQEVLSSSLRQTTTKGYGSGLPGSSQRTTHNKTGYFYKFIEIAQ